MPGLDIQNDIDENEFFQELGLQGIPFHQALGEILDNAISACISDDNYFDQDNPDDSFYVRISIIHKENGNVEIIVADNGKGMTEDVIEEHLFRPGHKDTDSGNGVLNEHGMGLKHSLSTLSNNGTDDSFKIITKTEDMDQDEIAKIEGPLSDPSGDIDDYSDLWEKGAGSLVHEPSGTRVHLTVPFSQINDSYARASHLYSVVPGLHEHFGVMYHRYLEHTSRNRLELSWEDEPENKSGELEIAPIYPQFREDKDEDGREWKESDKITITDEAGEDYEIEYERGIIDWEGTLEKYQRGRYDYEPLESEEGGSPFRIYYRNNQATQGINIVYRGRVLETGLLPEIWDEMVRHNRFNRFTGEIRIQDEKFQTLFNKTNINMDSKLWRKVRSELVDNQEYHPRAWGEDEQEQSLQKQIKENLKNDRNCVDVSREKDAGCDLDIDILQEFEEDDGETPVIIYEVKRSTARPLDVYQCVMYWDSYRHHKDDRLDEIVLVSDGISTNAKEVLDLATSRVDSEEDYYDIKQKEISDYPGVSL